MTAICVQRFDDSLNFAIRMTYRISLRSSSLREPRYPGYKVVFKVFYNLDNNLYFHIRLLNNVKNDIKKKIIECHCK